MLPKFYEKQFIDPKSSANPQLDTHKEKYTQAHLMKKLKSKDKKKILRVLKKRERPKIKKRHSTKKRTMTQMMVDYLLETMDIIKSILHKK